MYLIIFPLPRSFGAGLLPRALVVPEGWTLVSVNFKPDLSFRESKTESITETHRIILELENPMGFALPSLPFVGPVITVLFLLGMGMPLIFLSHLFWKQKACLISRVHSRRGIPPQGASYLKFLHGWLRWAFGLTVDAGRG